MNSTSQTLRALSQQDFAAFGVNDLAYLKPVAEDGQAAVAIHAADGTQLAVVSDRAVAMATVRQHDMEPLSLH